MGKMPDGKLMYTLDGRPVTEEPEGSPEEKHYKRIINQVRGWWWGGGGHVGGMWGGGGGVGVGVGMWGAEEGALRGVPDARRCPVGVRRRAICFRGCLPLAPGSAIHPQVRTRHPAH